MGDIHYLSGCDPNASSASESPVEDLVGHDIPVEDQVAATRALLRQQRDKENARWAAEKMARKKKVARWRLSFLLLGCMFSILQWWWAMGIALGMMLFTSTLMRWLLKE